MSQAGFLFDSYNARRLIIYLERPMRLVALSVFAFPAFVFLLPNAAWAEEEDDTSTERELREVVVSAAYSPAMAGGLNVPANLPAVSAGVSAEQLQQTTNLVSAEDALKYLPAIDVRKRFIGDRSSPVASRTTGSGFGARGLVYADGVLISNLLGNDNTVYTPRWSMIAPAEIQRVDVVYGPYSALYPGNAMGSVVLLSTRMTEKFEAHIGVQGFQENLNAYGTNDNYAGSQFSAALGAKQKGVSLWLSANHLDSHGQPMSFATAQAASGAAVNTATGAVPDKDMFDKNRLILGATGIEHTQQDNLKLKIGYDLTPATTATYTLGFWQNTSDMGYDSYLRDSNGQPVYSGVYRLNGISYSIPNTAFRNQQQEAQHWMHALALKNDSSDWSWEAVASLYDYDSDAARIQASTGSVNGSLTNMDGTGWKTLDLRGEWHPAGISHEVSFGYHLDQYTLQTRVQNVTNWVGSESGTPVSAFSGDTQTQALYMQDAWQFSSQWQSILGLRYENWQAYNGTVSSSNTTQLFTNRENNFVSPKAAMVYRPAADWVLRASVGRAYRLPTVAELYQGSLPNGANNVAYNNPDLKPEKVLATELSAEHIITSGVTSSVLRATIFNEDNHDALIKQTVPGVAGTTTYFMNIGKVRTQGAELAYQGTDVFMPRFDLSGSVTYAHSETLEDTAHLNYVGKTNYRLPLWRAKVVGTFRQTEKLSYSVGARYSGRQYATLDETDTNPDTYLGFSSYTVFDAKVSYRITPQFQASLGVDNLANTTYFQFHPYQGRTVVAELKFDY
jgi:iron complex outermembrane receptor protein